MTSIVAQIEHKYLSWETLVGKKTQQNFLDIQSKQVQCKTPIIRLAASSLLDWLLSLANLLECWACPNEGGASLIYTHQVSDRITQQGRLVSPTRADLSRETQNNIYKILLWVLFPRLTTKVLPHDFYMINYTEDISERRNNISERRNNDNTIKVTIEYLPKLHFFNTF